MSDAKSRQCVGDISLEVVYRLQVVVGLTLKRLVCTIQITTTMYYTLTIRLCSEWYTMQSCLEAYRARVCVYTVQLGHTLEMTRIASHATLCCACTWQSLPIELVCLNKPPQQVALHLYHTKIKFFFVF